MERLSGSLKALFLLMLCVILAFPCAASAASGVETDEEGGIWDYNKGVYTDPTGKQHAISSDDSSPSTPSATGDGSPMIIDTGEKDDTAGAKKNADGSIEVESGQFGVDIDESPTRAPLEGEAWQAALDSVAARNGRETPTTWTDPATGTAVSVEVVYMGIGRSMIKVDGHKKLVNTVDLKWETSAAEDQVLAVVRSRQIWMRKYPNDDRKNIKFEKVFRCSIVRVISVKKGWALVDYDGKRGYVKTGTLEFFANDHTEVENGYLSLNGKIKGKGRVQVRDPETMGILTGFQPGTPVTVFDILDDFAEIDVEGRHCYVNLSCLTLEQTVADTGAAQ